ncbi:MAG: restriction endonuclease [Propionicimonas sp.]|nr:restriction endonuclease [Propionicimonas sp.]
MGAEWLRGLDWRQFEALVARAYEAHGFGVTRTQDGADGGIDLVLTRGGERWFVQCKHWKAWKVGASVVREMRGLIAHHGASGGIVVTSGRFSEDAYAFARESGIQLVGGPATLALVTTGQLPNASLLGGTAPVGVATASPQVGAPLCPVCAGPMALQRARRGTHKGEAFWGCARYPSCRGMVPARPWEATHVAMRGATASPRQAQHSRPTNGRRPARRRSFGRTLAVALIAPLAGVVFLSVGLSLVSGLLSGVGSVPPRPQATNGPPGASAVPTQVLPSNVVRVGRQPMGITIDATARRGYTANFDSQDVSVIDLEQMHLVETIHTSVRPSAVAVDPERGVLWVADYNGARVLGIDLATGDQVAKLKTEAHPDHLAVDPEKNRLYVTCREADDILVFDTANQKRLKSIKGSRAGSLALDASSNQLYVAKRSAGNVYRYDLETKEWEKPAFGSLGAPDIAVDGERGRLYVADRALYERNLVVGGSRTLQDAHASSVAIDAQAETGYVLDTEAETVTAISLR